MRTFFFALAMVLAASPAAAGEKRLAFGERRTLWTGASARTPVFSPDGKAIVFVATGNGKTQIRFALVDADIEFGIFSVEDVSLGEPAFSPDGKRIAVVVRRKDAPANLTVFRFGSGRKRFGDEGVSEIPGTEGVTAIRWAADSSAVVCSVKGGQVVWGVGKRSAEAKQPLPEVPGGPYHPVAWTPDGAWCAAAKFVASPKTGIVRPAGLYLWKAPKPGAAKVEVKELLSPDEWLIGVYDTYAGTTSWSPDSKTIRFVGARLEPEPGKPYRPLCVWEVPREGGEPIKLYEYGWWPKRFWMSWGGHGLCAWRYDMDPAMYATDLATGETLRFEGRGGLSKNRFAFAPGCRRVAVLSKTGLDLVEIKVVDAPPPEEKEEKNE